jgi:hypothetical protein
MWISYCSNLAPIESRASVPQERSNRPKCPINGRAARGNLVWSSAKSVCAAESRYRPRRTMPGQGQCPRPRESQNRTEHLPALPSRQSLRDQIISPREPRARAIAQISRCMFRPNLQRGTDATLDYVGLPKPLRGRCAIYQRRHHALSASRRDHAIPRSMVIKERRETIIGKQMSEWHQ